MSDMSMHDVSAAERNATLLSRLRELGSRAAKPYLEQAARSVTAGSVAELYLSKTDDLIRFLKSSRSASEVVSETDEVRSLFNEFRDSLRTALGEADSRESIDEFIGELAGEFSRSFWGLLLRRMRRRPHGADPLDLIAPDSGHVEANRQLVSEVEAELPHFGLQPEDLSAIVCDTLGLFVTEAQARGESRIEWPYGLTFDSAAVARRLGRPFAIPLRQTRQALSAGRAAAPRSLSG